MTTQDEAKRIKKRNCAEIELYRIDYEAVRAVTSPRGMLELERIRSEYMPDKRHLESFWRTAREQMVRGAQKRPDSAARIMAAKVGAVGAMLGLSSADITRLTHQVDMPRFVAAAGANHSIQKFQNDPEYFSLWIGNRIRNNPPIRVEFEHATVFGCINEAGDIAKSKSWGRLTDLEPLQPDDGLFPRHITYVLKSTSKLRMRWEFRDTFKAILGNRRSLVNDAVRTTKRRFVEDINPDDAKVIRDRLHLAPDLFWQMARHGEKCGPNGILSFMKNLEEKTKGYILPFPELKHSPAQIQPSSKALGDLFQKGSEAEEEPAGPLSCGPVKIQC